MELTEEAKKFRKFLKETDQELFCGCINIVLFLLFLNFFHKKCMNAWSKKSFTELLGTLRETLQMGEKLLNLLIR